MSSSNRTGCHSGRHLRDFLGAAAETTRAPDDAVVELPFVGSVYAGGLTVTVARSPSGATVLGREREGGGAAAWMKQIRGGGRAIWLGMQWAHGMRYHATLLRGCLGKLGMEPRRSCSNPNVWCALWTHEERSVLFVMNLLVARQDAQIACQPAWSRKLIRLAAMSLPGMTVKTIGLRDRAR